MTRRLFATAVLALAVLAPAALVIAETLTWDAGYEAQPDATKPVSEGDDRIRELKRDVRERARPEHEWNDGGQTGRHRVGSARSWLQAAAPATLNEPDSDASTTLDNGRIWAESDAGTAVDPAVECCVRLNVRDQSNVAGFGATKWVQVIGVPTNGIILWDQATGDEDCNGAMLADECPCGFVEATEFQNLLVRGADTGNANGNVPNEPGVSCPGGGACAAGTQYDDTLDTIEMPAHTHDTTLLRGDNDHGNPALAADPFDVVSDDDNADTVITSSSTGGAGEHLHPFRSVLFCRAR